MPKLIKIALAANAVALFCTAPCLFKTTPGTMMLFFMTGIPLFAIGFVCYLAAVIRDLKRHEVI